MINIFIDSSVFIRLLTHDNEKKTNETLELFRLIESGKLKPYTSNIVFLEILFVLTKLYKFALTEVVADLRKILNLRNLTLVETTDTKLALDIITKYKINYGDCFIISQIPQRVILVTYDRDFKKIPSLSVQTPSELLAKS